MSAATGRARAALLAAFAAQARRTEEAERETRTLRRVLRDARENEQLQNADPVLCCEIDNVLGETDVR